MPSAPEVVVRRAEIADVVVCGMFPGERSSWSFEKCYVTAGDSAYEVRRCHMCLNEREKRTLWREGQLRDPLLRALWTGFPTVNKTHSLKA